MFVIEFCECIFNILLLVIMILKILYSVDGYSINKIRRPFSVILLSFRGSRAMCVFTLEFSDTTR